MELPDRSTHYSGVSGSFYTKKSFELGIVDEWSLRFSKGSRSWIVCANAIVNLDCIYVFFAELLSDEKSLFRLSLERPDADNPITGVVRIEEISITPGRETIDIRFVFLDSPHVN